MLKDRSEVIIVGTKYQQIKRHVIAHREGYIFGIGGLAIGALLMKGSTYSPVINNTVAPVIAPVFNNTVNNGGHVRKIVRCVETGEMWLSVTESALAQNVSLSRMSQHLNGHKEQINKLHFVIEALATG
jgi:hypothetical protein